MLVMLICAAVLVGVGAGAVVLAVFAANVGLDDDR